MRRLAASLALAVVSAAVGSGCSVLADEKAGAHGSRATVVSIADGDTIKVRRDGRESDVRLIGVDAPESSALRYGAPDCGGEKAKRAMESLVGPGDRVKLVVDATQDRRDRYGRLLRYVERGGRDLGAVQVKRGLAEVYVYDRSSPPRRTAAYERARARAEAAGAGVFSLCGGDFHTAEGE